MSHIKKKWHDPTDQSESYFTQSNFHDNEECTFFFFFFCFLTCSVHSLYMQNWSWMRRERNVDTYSLIKIPHVGKILPWVRKVTLKSMLHTGLIHWNPYQTTIKIQKMGCQSCPLMGVSDSYILLEYSRNVPYAALWSQPRQTKSNYQVPNFI